MIISPLGPQRVLAIQFEITLNDLPLWQPLVFPPITMTNWKGAHSGGTPCWRECQVPYPWGRNYKQEVRSHLIAFTAVGRAVSCGPL